MKKRPKPRNPVARDLWQSGAFKHRVVEDKKKKATQPRKQKHRKATENNDD